MSVVMIVLIIVLFIMILIPMFKAAPVTQQELDIKLDERMRAFQAQAHRRAFISSMIFAAVLMFADFVRELQKMSTFASPSVYLLWVILFGLAVYFAEMRIKGIDVGIKGNEKATGAMVWIWGAILLSTLIPLIEDGFHVYTALPLNLGQGILFGGMVFSTMQIFAQMVRRRRLKKEAAEAEVCEDR